jgi:hypothetical protein
LLSCWLWTLFKDNLSFPGNERADDLLSKLLKIEFDIGDSLFQGFSVRLAYVRSYLNCLTLGKWFALAKSSCREDDVTNGQGYGSEATPQFLFLFLGAALLPPVCRRPLRLIEATASAGSSVRLNADRLALTGMFLSLVAEGANMFRRRDLQYTTFLKFILQCTPSQSRSSRHNCPTLRDVLEQHIQFG